MVMVVGIVLFSLSSIRGIIYTLIKHLIKLDYKPNKQLAPILNSIVLAFDGMDNACSGEYRNDRYLKKNGVKYGKWYDTTSAITGVNAERQTLNKKGRKFRRNLDFVFSLFGEKGSHTANAVKKYYER